MLTEASQKKRASLHLVISTEALAQFDRGGIDPLECTLADFRAALKRENPRSSGAWPIRGCCRASAMRIAMKFCLQRGCPPVKLTDRMSDDESSGFIPPLSPCCAIGSCVLNKEAAARFPEKVTAFRPEMAVHGGSGKPCPVWRNDDSTDRACGKRKQLLPAVPGRRQNCWPTDRCRGF